MNENAPVEHRGGFIRAMDTWIVAFMVVFMACVALFPSVTEAASLSLSPATGVYKNGDTFSVSVVVDTKGQPINAADATISFNPRELSVVSVSRTSSIFNLWVAEPSFSNSAGTISFSGGLPSGYTGNRGSVVTITFRSLGSGSSRVTLQSGSVLANDGRGTNVLTAMNGGSYTIQAQSAEPEPEIIEYVAPANTPAAPSVASKTHDDPDAWHMSKTAELAWQLPAGVTAVRTLLNDEPTAVPVKVYDTPISSITLEDLSEGVSYFHVQFKNADGWGRVTHYRLAVDSVSPTAIQIASPKEDDPADPEQRLVVSVEDETSPVTRYLIKVNAAEPFEFLDETGSGTIALPPLDPGYHTVFIEAFDAAGNSITGTYSFTIEAFDPPVFVEYPTRMNEEVVPVITGTTRANATVEIVLEKIGSEPNTYTIISNAEGVFTFIPEGTLSTGVYELTARATDTYGAKSSASETIRIVVEQPGYLRVGGFIVSVLSVVVPLVILVLSLILGAWYLLLRITRLRRKVRKETVEALDILQQEFAALQSTLGTATDRLRASRKTNRLTKSETELVDELRSALSSSEDRVREEIEDVSELVSKDNQPQ